MSDPENTTDEVARMTLEADAWHDGEDGVYVDCPECGSPAYMSDIIDNGRCTGYLGSGSEEEGADDVGGFCTAKLSFELAWTEEP
ncbi:hypothetical protein ACNS7O_16970 (plasmid) [Haloferacaceae archaeon DSL9]